MGDAVICTTDEEIDAALERAKAFDAGPLAVAVTYDDRLNVVVIQLSTGRRLVLPVEDLQGLADATSEQLSHTEIVNLGRGISFTDLDVDHFLPALIGGVYGNQRWMQHLLSQKMQAAA